MRTRGAALAGLVLLSLSATPVLADSVTTPRACPAANRIADITRDRETLPAGSYAVKDRHPSGAFIRLGGSQGDRWIEADCALGGAPAFRDTAFFDDVDEGPGDLRPPPPRLDDFDHAVLDVCGPWGAKPDRAAFTALVASEPEIIAAAGGLKALTEAWFGADGFAHVFCGEPGKDGLGGFHYQGRYLQAQREGWAGFSAGCAVREKDGPILTFGVRYKGPGGAERTQCPKGYVHGQSARDLMLAATRAWKAATRRDGACLAPLTGAEEGAAVVVLRGGALRTYYGDATPDRSLPACGSRLP